MYKEMVQRKKFPAIVLLFITLIVFICLSDVFTKVSIGRINIKTFVTMFFNTLMIALCYMEFSKCKVKYKYSIVADQFIIHKIKGEEVKILEDIKLKDIDYIGKYKNYSAGVHISSSKKYICSTFIGSKFCCIYKVGDNFKKFYFEPSDGFMNKIKLLKEKAYFKNK
ncbi:hypothetical protein K2F40_13595 [Clostridium sp. CM028]|uniref:hypothetical protein n=1 Tax=Clostridium TaxID=1485 RepID=UPI0013EEA904|nr:MULTISPECIES: hypothetical protein [Clostridium]MBU3093812.1 hypothetical protein [Clostridium sp. CF011]MBW9146409.1 hypothetical protein [Clostridium sp. CM027]MBW9149990.1 hypothetical protein [Clostridium sp. CM028]MBZ9606238.1 hypothetical protein [Clostridium estertheticum]UVE39919.1 hypothetical protein KTC92_11840 [Clostridium sp. CM027]